MKPKILAALLAFVLLLHLSGLAWFSDQLRGITPLAPMPEPMLTRIIEQAEVARPPPILESGSTGKTVATARFKKGQAATVPRASKSVTAQLWESTDPANQGSGDLVPVPPLPVAPDTSPEAVAAAPSFEETALPVAKDPTTLTNEHKEPDSWPPDTRLNYRMTGNYRGAVSGSAKVLWQRDRGTEVSRYQVRLDISLSGISVATMTSQGLAVESGLQPSTYEERLPGTQRQVTFDGAQIRFQNGSVGAQPNAVQDAASQFVELSRRFSSGREALRPGTEVSLWLARPGGVDRWTYDVMEPETLHSHALGEIQAFRLKPRPLVNPRGPIIAEMWFAPSLQYLPVRVRIALGDDNFVDLMVDKIEQSTLPAPVKSGEVRLVDPT